MSHFERLSALDASFLEIEDESCHMHVAATLLFEPGPLGNSTGGVDASRIRDYRASAKRRACPVVIASPTKAGLPGSGRLP